MNESPQKMGGKEARGGFLSLWARRGVALVAAAFGRSELKQSDMPVVPWSIQWVRKNPELALEAFQVLHQRVMDLEHQMKSVQINVGRWSVPADHPGPIRMALLMPNTRFLLVRTGVFYTTTDKRNKWGRPIQIRDDGAVVSLHGSVRVIPFPPKENT